MYVETDTEYVADVILIRKEADIRIGAGVSLTLIARDSVHIEPGVIVRSIGREAQSDLCDSSEHCLTDTNRNGRGEEGGHVGDSGSSAGNFIICTTHLEFEQDMERFFYVALVGGKGRRGGLFWLNLVESTENRIVVEKISPPILIGGEEGDAASSDNGSTSGIPHNAVFDRRNAVPRGSTGIRGKKGNQDNEGEFKITFFPTFSDALKRLGDEG